ncbi:MAG: hypothetical protein FWE14_00195 [Lachnospiraceae bacterium]|nr:hypothetical protein [Lachnospiraceae bacterium]
MENLQLSPYNNLLFKNCYYNMLFAVLIYFKLDISYFMSNSIVSYKVSENMISNSYIDIKNENSLLNDMGVDRCEIKVEKHFFIETLQGSINNNSPILIESDVFEKIILIIGYNESSIKIIEQRYPDTLSYSFNQISIQEIMESSLFSNNYETKISCFLHKHDKFQNKSEDSFFNYCHNYVLCESLIMTGITDMNVFMENFKLISSIADILAGEKMISGLNNIVNSYRVVENILRSSCDNKALKLLELNKAIENNWCLIRNKLVKYSFSRQMGIEVNVIFDIIKKICIDEYTYFNLINERKGMQYL